MPPSPNRGIFITLEGIEGVGKSTQLEHAADCLRNAGRKVVVTREPGGTRAGEAIRDILLHRDHLSIGDLTELLLMFSARAQHVIEVIRPALEKGESVLCDRFTDATLAYQGGGRGIDPENILALARMVHPGLQPHLTILLDAPVAVGLARAGRRSAQDRFESENADFFEKVRRAYLDIARLEPARFAVVNADRPPDAVRDAIAKILAEREWI